MVSQHPYPTTANICSQDGSGAKGCVTILAEARNDEPQWRGQQTAAKTNGWNVEQRTTKGEGATSGGGTIDGGRRIGDDDDDRVVRGKVG